MKMICLSLLFVLAPLTEGKSLRNPEGADDLKVAEVKSTPAKYLVENLKPFGEFQADEGDQLRKTKKRSFLESTEEGSTNVIYDDTVTEMMQDWITGMKKKPADTKSTKMSDSETTRKNIQRTGPSTRSHLSTTSAQMQDRITGMKKKPADTKSTKMSDSETTRKNIQRTGPSTRSHLSTTSAQMPGTTKASLVQTNLGRYGLLIIVGLVALCFLLIYTILLLLCCPRICFRNKQTSHQPVDDKSIESKENAKLKDDSGIDSCTSKKTDEQQKTGGSSGDADKPTTVDPNNCEEKERNEGGVARNDLENPVEISSNEAQQNIESAKINGEKNFVTTFDLNTSELLINFIVENGTGVGENKAGLEMCDGTQTSSADLGEDHPKVVQDSQMTHL